MTALLIILAAVALLVIGYVVYGIVNRHIARKVGLLGPIRNLRLRDYARSVPVNKDIARVVVDKAREYFDKRGLAAAVGAEQTYDVTSLKVKGYSVEHLFRAV